MNLLLCGTHNSVSSGTNSNSA